MPASVHGPPTRAGAVPRIPGGVSRHEERRAEPRPRHRQRVSWSLGCRRRKCMATHPAGPAPTKRACTSGHGDPHAAQRRAAGRDGARTRPRDRPRALFASVTDSVPTPPRGTSGLKIASVLQTNRLSRPRPLRRHPIHAKLRYTGCRGAGEPRSSGGVQPVCYTRRDPVFPCGLCPQSPPTTTDRSMKFTACLPPSP